MSEYKRYPGFITPLKSHHFPKHFILWDTETTIPKKYSHDDTFDLKLGVLIYVELDKQAQVKRREVYRFSNVHEFIAIIMQYSRKKTALNLYAHNIGFDVRVLDLPFVFDEYGYKSTPPIINERTFIWKVSTDKGTLNLLDTANFGVLSVAELGENMGLEKLSIDFDTCTLDELFTYCLRDVEVLEQFVIGYIQYIVNNQLGSVKTTLAGQAMTAFRTRFISNPPYIHIDERALKLEREGYHGGRVECSRLGRFSGETFYYLDVNSMYPHSMVSGFLPQKFLGYSENVRLSYLPIRLNGYYVVAECTLNTDEPVYSIIKNNKLIFPTGQFTTVLYHPELQYAYEHGHILSISKCAIYLRNTMFTDYVDYFYGLKVQHGLENNKSWRYIDKLFLNSLYGKFGQLKPHRDLNCTLPYEGVYRLPCINSVTGRHYQEIMWYGDLYTEYKEGETLLSNPAIAGAITSKARMLLWSYIKQAGLSNVYYVDTDSLIVNGEGYENLQSVISPNDLGKLKLEKQSDILEVWGNKDYKFGDTEKIKGIPKHAERLTHNKWEFLQFEGFLTWLNRGAKGSVKGKYATKERRSAYNKGIVSSEGIVTPFPLSLTSPLLLKPAQVLGGVSPQTRQG